jgi:hypothetical protein
MKKVLTIALLALLGVYLTGRITLGTNGALNFLIEMENLTNNGKADEVCALFSDDLEVSLSDHTTEEAKDLAGGKEELCEYTHAAVAALRMLPHKMNVEWTEFEVTRSWWHPWTSEISFTEDRTLMIRGANVRLNTTSDNTMTLVQTFSGVKLRKLTGESWLAE